MSNPVAKKAVDAEYNKLRYSKMPDPKDKRIGVWDETRVREQSDVRAEAKKLGKTVHFASIIELCMEKGSELPDNHPGKKFKGRAERQ